MENAGQIWLRLAALSGLVSVGAGAFGAHGAASPAAAELLRTGASYQAIAALAVLAAVLLARQGARRMGVAPGLFLAGTVLFSGSLYALALGGPHWVGAVTPLGGIAFMGGWAALAFGRAPVAR